jgi:hypothetical protein
LMPLTINADWELLGPAQQLLQYDRDYNFT